MWVKDVASISIIQIGSRTGMVQAMVVNWRDVHPVRVRVTSPEATGIVEMGIIEDAYGGWAVAYDAMHHCYVPWW